jgi:hypothetical protein
MKKTTLYCSNSYEMKNRIFLFVSLIICIINTLNAQSFKFGTIVANAGIAGGVYISKSHFPGDTEDNLYADWGARLPSFDAEFGLLKFLGVGVHYSRSVYTLASIYKAKGKNVGLTLNFHLANKNKNFDLPIGITYGLTDFGSDENVKFSTEPQHIYASGTLLNIHVLPHFYFGKYIGMYIGISYNRQIFNKTEWLNTKDGKIYTQADGFNWRMNGVSFEMGIAGRLHLLNKKE